MGENNKFHILTVCMVVGMVIIVMITFGRCVMQMLKTTEMVPDTGTTNNTVCLHERWNSGKCLNCGITCLHKENDDNGYCVLCGKHLQYTKETGNVVIEKTEEKESEQKSEKKVVLKRTTDTQRKSSSSIRPTQTTTNTIIQDDSIAKESSNETTRNAGSYIWEYIPELGNAHSMNNEESTILSKIYGLQMNYPEGAAWGMEQYYASTRASLGGWACSAFSALISDTVFTTPFTYSQTYYDTASIRVGDVVDYTDSLAPLGHQVVVLEVFDNGIKVCEGNNAGKIRWGRYIYWGESRFNYGVSRYVAAGTEVYIPEMGFWKYFDGVYVNSADSRVYNSYDELCANYEKDYGVDNSNNAVIGNTIGGDYSISETISSTIDCSSMTVTETAADNVSSSTDYNAMIETGTAIYDGYTLTQQLTENYPDSPNPISENVVNQNSAE